MACGQEFQTDTFSGGMPREEVANTITHGIGLALSVCGGTALLILAPRQQGTWLIAACAIYAASLVAVYAASTLSHAIQRPRLKRFFQIWDQGLIYLLIAGSFTPFALQYLSAGSWWVLLDAMWVVALLGFFAKIILEHRIEAVSARPRASCLAGCRPLRLSADV